MRYLGLDLGTKSLGISISDRTNVVASTYKTIYFNDKDYDSLLEPLKEIVQEEEISKIVLGLPKNMNNSLGFRSLETIDFQKKLENYLNIKVELQDERLTTIEAEHYMLQADLSRKKRKQKKDQLAANIILQSYLDKEKGR